MGRRGNKISGECAVTSKDCSKLNEDEDKIHTSLPVVKLAVLHRLLVIAKIIINGQYTNA